MRFTNLENRVIYCKSNKDERDLLIDEYLPFIKSTINKVVNNENSDFLTIGMMAFLKAIETFNITKGKFLVYAKLLIRNNVISEIRKQSKHKTVLLADYTESDQEINILRKLELDIFIDELLKFNISINDLITHSPKHIKTRKKCFIIAKTIKKHKELQEYVYKKHKLPIKETLKYIDVSIKVFERFRKYIISLVILQDEQFSYLHDLVF